MARRETSHGVFTSGTPAHRSATRAILASEHSPCPGSSLFRRYECGARDGASAGWRRGGRRCAARAAQRRRSSRELRSRDIERWQNCQDAQMSARRARNQTPHMESSVVRAAPLPACCGNAAAPQRRPSNRQPSTSPSRRQRDVAKPARQTAPGTVVSKTRPRSPTAW